MKKPPLLKSASDSPPGRPEGASFDKLIYSETAIRRGLDNLPPEEVKVNLAALAGYLLEPLRELYGKKIAITSGYRSPELNRLVKGAANSQHILGEAADLWIPEGPQCLLDILLESGLPFDQAIVYRRRNFIHLSYTSRRVNRMQVLFR